MEFIKKAESI